MNAERLLDAFDRLGDEPETVQQFRKLVVGLAISGKLLAPDEAAVDPSNLLKQIETKKRALVQQGLLRKQSPLSAVALEDLPKGFGDPSNFIRLGELARIEKGQTGIMKAEPGAYPLVVTAEERSTCDHFDFDGAAAIVPLVSSAGHGKASIQRLHYQEGKFALGSILAAIFPHAPELISARFLFEYLTSFKDELLVSQMIGTANVSLSVGKVSDVPVPLVPPMVQRKVDELMGLCDRLEAARAGREATRDRLAAASLARLNAPEPESFQADARFALDALPALTTRPDQIKRLRQTILNLAVRGKLVPQDPNDEPASELLKRIAKEKARLVKAGEIRDKPTLAAVTDADMPFPIPSKWEWVRFANIVEFSAGRTPSRNDTSFWNNGDHAWVSIADMQDGQVLTTTKETVSDKTRERVFGSEPEPPGTILMSFKLTIGKIARLGVPAFHNEAIISIRPHLAELDAYLFKIIPQFARQGDTKGAIKGATLNRDSISNILLPLPPLAEQHRIVAKVDALMALCDRLEASLTATAATRRRLLDALLAEALAPVDARELEAAE